MSNVRKAKPLSASAIGHIVNQLRILQGQGRTKVQGSRTFVTCPFHNEKTPSCLVTTNPSSKFEVGSFTCMGCGESGRWNKLAEALGLEPVGEDHNVSKTVQKYQTDFYDSMLKERYVSYKTVLADLEIGNPAKLDGKSWRTLPADFLEKVQACQVEGVGKLNKGTKYLFLPALMNGEVVGGVRAVMQDTTDKTVVKYKNSSGEWSRSKGLYPFDYVAAALKQFYKDNGFRALVLVEGARDALCLNCEGIPALGLLGTQSWCEGKLSYVLDLDPDFVLVAMDGDKAGRLAEEKVWNDLRKFLPTRKMNLTRFNKECGKEVDPGNAPSWVIDKIWQTLLKRRQQ